MNMDYSIPLLENILCHLEVHTLPVSESPSPDTPFLHLYLTYCSLSLEVSHAKTCFGLAVLPTVIFVSLYQI